MSMIMERWGDLSPCMQLPPENCNAPRLEWGGQLPSMRAAKQSFVIASSHTEITQGIWT